MTTPMLTCDDTQALMPDLLDDTLVGPRRAQYDTHVAGCDACRALARDLAAIRDDAVALPVMAPTRDLWAGIEARIATPVVAMKAPARRASGRWTTRQVAAAAAVLVAVTAGGTWMAATRATVLAPAIVATAPGTRTDLVSVADQKGIATYESEIAKLRGVLDARGSELDSGTVALIRKNLALIDAAITESKAALAADPASTFLADRLNYAYGTKLDLLRAAATMPSHS